MKTPLIYLVAGEASGDALGAGLMRALREERPGVRFAGIGGEAMEREGLKSLFPYTSLSVMGFSEVLPHISTFLRLLRKAALDIAAQKPNAVVTIDSPGFNFRLASALKENTNTKHIKRIHYVAPSVWAYKPQRARRTAELFNHLLALLPFEPPYFEKEGLPTTFVGHPVLWEKQQGDDIGFRAHHRLSADIPILLVLPGSRVGEVKQHLSVFMQAAEALPDFKVAVLASPDVQQLIRSSVTADTLVVDIAEKYDAFAASTLALSKSGTITLELAVAGVPMVVAHKVSALSAWLLRRMRLMPYVSLVNIIVKKFIVPELLQEECTAEQIIPALRVLALPEAAERQRQDIAHSLELLRGKSAVPSNTVAAKAVLRCLA